MVLKPLSSPSHNLVHLLDIFEFHFFLVINTCFVYIHTYTWGFTGGVQLESPLIIQCEISKYHTMYVKCTIQVEGTHACVPDSIATYCRYFLHRRLCLHMTMKYITNGEFLHSVGLQEQLLLQYITYYRQLQFPLPQKTLTFEMSSKAQITTA